MTYRSGPSIWAFGHPIDGAGRRALPLQDAYVFSVIENPLNIEDARTRKFAVSGHTVGALTNDFDAAIAGRVGPPPTTIPFRAVIRDQGRGRSHVIRTDVSDERSLELGSALDMVGTFALGQGSGQALGSSPPGWQAGSACGSPCASAVARWASATSTSTRWPRWTMPRQRSS